MNIPRRRGDRVVRGWDRGRARGELACSCPNQPSHQGNRRSDFDHVGGALPPQPARASLSSQTAPGKRPAPGRRSTGKPAKFPVAFWVRRLGETSAFKGCLPIDQPEAASAAGCRVRAKAERGVSLRRARSRGCTRVVRSGDLVRWPARIARRGGLAGTSRRLAREISFGPRVGYVGRNQTILLATRSADWMTVSVVSE